MFRFHLRKSSILNQRNIHQEIHNKNSRIIAINDITRSTEPANNPSLVPKGYYERLVYSNSNKFSQDILSHLRWMMQKDTLNQDMFLIGPSGPYRRRLAMYFCEMMNYEVEYISISSDTTESDLKQRREIKDGNSIYMDQGPIRAAKHGRLLIIEGIEKAEKNVLSLLNNLIENREINLEDGTYLMHYNNYKELIKLKNNTNIVYDSNCNHLILNENKNIITTNRKFRVIALGQPGLLDPPLRSRFQARNIYTPEYSDLYEHLVSLLKLDNNRQKFIDIIKNLLQFHNAILNDMYNNNINEKNSLPIFPFTELSHIINIFNNFPESENNITDLIYRIYPFFPNPTEDNRIDNLLKICNLKDDNVDAMETVSQIHNIIYTDNYTSDIIFNRKSNTCQFSIKVTCGQQLSRKSFFNEHFISNIKYEKLFYNLLQDHTLGRDICLIGGKGSGKSFFINQFCSFLGYTNNNDTIREPSIEIFSLYKDMTTRDLLQKRATNNKGDTIWQDSPLIKAAKNGSMVILDGIHRLNIDTLSSLSQLLTDRQITLQNEILISNQNGRNMNEKMLEDNNNIFIIPDSFRVIALTENLNTFLFDNNNKLNSEIFTMFKFHQMPSLEKDDILKIVTKLYPNLSTTIKDTLLDFYFNINNSKNNNIHLNLRQLLRLCQRMQIFPFIQNLRISFFKQEN